MTKQGIINAIEEHLGKSYKRYYQDFYVGITSDINARLFVAHNVPEKGHWYIYQWADSEDIAREVEKHFLDLGMDGGTGGGTGDGDVRYVYCYEKGPNTRP